MVDLLHFTPTCVMFILFVTVLQLQATSSIAFTYQLHITKQYHAATDKNEWQSSQDQGLSRTSLVNPMQQALFIDMYFTWSNNTDQFQRTDLNSILLSGQTLILAEQRCETVNEVCTEQKYVNCVFVHTFSNSASDSMHIHHMQTLSP